jgi:hypothetical protein
MSVVFFRCPPPTYKTYHHDIAEILLKVALNIITHTKLGSQSSFICVLDFVSFYEFTIGFWNCSDSKAVVTVVII